MDKKISKEVVKQRRNRKIIKLSIILGIIAICFTFLVKTLQPTIDLSEVKVSTVTRGDLSVSTAAIGKVVPYYQEIITSPVSTKIVNVLKKSGDKISTGDAILELDLESFSADVKKQNEELKLKELKLKQFKVATASTLKETRLQINIDSMKLQRMAVALRNELYLDSIGASTVDKVKQIELDYKIQKMQFEQFKEKFENQKITAEVDIITQELDYKAAINNISILNKRMQEAYVRSTRTATLTWVNDEIGANISAGDNLAIVSDLENYKIEGELSDSYSDKITSGNKVEIKLAGQTLSGVVGNISPSVSDGIVKFSVSIDESNHEKLRSGLKLDLHIVNSVKDDVLTIDNSSYYVGAGEYDLWVISGGKAIKRKVMLGESNFNKVEVVSGLENGEKVIVSDMSRYDDKKEMNIK